LYQTDVEQKGKRGEKGPLMVCEKGGGPCFGGNDRVWWERETGGKKKNWGKEGTETIGQQKGGGGCENREGGGGEIDTRGTFFGLTKETKRRKGANSLFFTKGKGRRL